MFLFKKYIVTFLFLVLPIFTLGCNNKKLDINYTVATVNESPISVGEFKKVVSDFKKRFDLDYVNDDQREKVLSMAMDSLIEKKIVAMEAVKLGIRISDEDINSFSENLIKEYTPLNFKEMLVEKEIDIKDWNEKIKESIQLKKIITVISNKGIKIDEKEITKYYNNNEEKFYKPFEIHAKQIVVTTYSQARQIRNSISNKDDFIKAVKKYSISPHAKRGGDLGYFSKGYMPKEFDDVIFQLRIGEISDVVQTPYGYHIFTVLDKREARKVTLKEARKDIEQKLSEEKQEKRLNEWFKEIRKKAKIIIFDSVIKKIDINAS